MKVVAHQAKRVHLPPRFFAAFGERFQKTLTVPVISEGRLLPVAPVHDAVDRAGVLDAQFSRHRFTIATRPVSGQQNITFSLTDLFTVVVIESVAASVCKQPIVTAEIRQNRLLSFIYFIHGRIELCWF